MTRININSRKYKSFSRKHTRIPSFKYSEKNLIYVGEAGTIRLRGENEIEPGYVDKIHANTNPGHDASSDDNTIVIDGADPSVTVAVNKWARTIPNPRTRRNYIPHVLAFVNQLNGKPLSKIDSQDLEEFVSSKRTYFVKHMALSAVKHFLKHADVKIPRMPYIGQKLAPPPIKEPTKAEMARLWGAVSGMNLAERAAMYLLRDTGHRRRSIALLPRGAITKHDDRPICEFRGDTDKRGNVSVCPILNQTYNTCLAVLETHTEPTLFPLSNWKHPEDWISDVVYEAAKRARMETRMYAHLFRHMKALQCRRHGLESDTVVNLLGWADPTVYNARYGRRTPYETINEARTVLEPIAEPTQKEEPLMVDLRGLKAVKNGT